MGPCEKRKFGLRALSPGVHTPRLPLGPERDCEPGAGLPARALKRLFIRPPQLATASPPRSRDRDTQPRREGVGAGVGAGRGRKSGPESSPVFFGPSPLKTLHPFTSSLRYLLNNLFTS